MTDYRVDRLSFEKIEDHAHVLLAGLPTLPKGGIDILAALRLPKVKTIHGTKTLRLNLVADDLLPDKLAQVWVGEGRVSVTARLSVWNRAQEGDPEALRVLRHEFGHVLLHSDARTKSAVPLDRQLGGNTLHKFIEPDCSAERQADAIAACLAMPRGMIRPSMEARDMSANWNVPLKEAQWRLERVRAAAPKRLSDALKRDLALLRAGSEVTPQARQLWDQLPLAPDTPRAVGRLADGYLIEYCQYNSYTQTGWAVESGRVIPLIVKMCQ